MISKIRFVAALASAAVASGSVVVSSAGAALLAVEDFSYGAAGGPLGGKGTSANGFSGPWSGDANWTYNPVGLTFGDLPSSGGSANGAPDANNNLGIFARRNFASSLPSGGPYWGSFLSRIGSQTGTVWTNSVFVGSNADGDTSATFILKSKEFGINNAALQVETGYAELAGSPVATGTTYLNLFKADPGGKALTMWILTAAQYTNFNPGGITESELNAATTGGGSTQVLERASASTTATLDPVTTLTLFNYANSDGGVSNYDRIILSSDSLNGAVVPEPASLALLAAGATLLPRRRRRRRKAG